MRLLGFLFLLVAAPLAAAPLPGDAMARLRQADVLWLGETHDNPHHHARQAELVAALEPAALVFEMLTREQAAKVTPDLIADPQAMAEALRWSDSGWPDFAMYHPIFAAAPGARIVGALVPRDAARAAMKGGIAATFGEGAEVYGLDRPLPETEQAAREADQMAAHCDALPESILPQMVAIQRLRDAVLARAALTALRETGGPVVVITGNGHARTDRGGPVYLKTAAPEIPQIALGQTEEGRIDGVFDLLADSPAIQRPDPCEAFRKGE